MNRNNFRMAVLRGLSRERKRIPCKYLYDAEGVALFEEICRLDEYYLTRSEVGLLERHAEDVARLAGSGRRVIEFGGCSSRKARMLLDALDQPSAYVPVDIARQPLTESAKLFAASRPELPIFPVCGDYLAKLDLPNDPAGPALGFFPGSTIGNLSPRLAVNFLARCATLLGPRSLMLVGVDVKKDERLLTAAYNDRRGLSAAFNLNILARINRELDGDFDLSAFEHSARWDDRQSRIEIEVVSRARQRVRAAGQRFTLGRREPIHTEYSYKYGDAEFHWLARQAGWNPVATFGDGMFSLHVLDHTTRH